MSTQVILSKSMREYNSQNEIQMLPFRVFINNVDTYSGKYLASHLGQQGISLNPERETTSSTTKISEETVSLTSIEKILSGNLPLLTQTSKKYEIVGTLSNPKASECLEEYVVVDEKLDFGENILKCRFVIFDINNEKDIGKALTALSIIEQEIQRNITDEVPRVFILISNIMTWALTPPLNQKEKDILYLEIDFKKRKPHPNYKNHFFCEKEVLQKGRKFKGRLETYVVCSGVTYGLEEDTLAFLFKRAWNNETTLPIFESGNNYIPLIHVLDLARIISKLIEMVPEEKSYILAVEQTPSTLKQITKTISRTLGTGKTHHVSKEEAFLYPDIDQEIFDKITVNLLMEPEFILETLKLNWQSEFNLVENIDVCVEEFKSFRNLLNPIKIFVHGPPSSGKTRIAKKICSFYNLYYVSVKSLIEEMLTEMKLWQQSSKKQSNIKFPVDEWDEVVTDESDQSLDEEEMTKLEKHCDEFAKNNDNKLTDEQVAAMLRTRLTKNCCQNLGFVIEGYPKTLQQAKDLFNLNKSEEKDLILTPNYVIHLEASNEFLFDRVSTIPEKDIRNTHYVEKEMVRRLVFYRHNTDYGNNSLLNFFDESVTRIINISVEDHPSESMDELFKLVQEKLGPPIGFGLTPEEHKQIDILKQENESLEIQKQEFIQKMHEEKSSQEKDCEMQNLEKSIERSKNEKERIMIVKSDPFRTYLAKCILPVLSKALMTIAAKNTGDPIDALAICLVKTNPGGKMFDPSYSQTGELLQKDRKV